MFGLCRTVNFRRTVAEIPVHTGNIVRTYFGIKLNAITKTELILATITIGKGLSIHVHTLFNGSRTN